MVVKKPNDWMNEVAKMVHPHSKTVKVIDYWFGTAGNDDIVLEYNRCFDGYSDDHFTPESLAELYCASSVTINNDYTLTIQ